MLDILIFAALAAFIFFKLRSVLGQHDDDQRPPASRNDNTIPFPPRANKPATASKRQDLPTRAAPVFNEQANTEPEIDDPALKKGVDAIRAADPRFHLGHFITGAKAAFEMILEAYNKGDKNTLKALLSKELYGGFEKELEKRAKAKKKEESTLVSIQDAALKAASLTKKTARLTLEFTSEQITVFRNDEGEIVDGDPSQVDMVTDRWTFERNVNSSDPNWTITATS